MQGTGFVAVTSTIKVQEKENRERNPTTYPAIALSRICMLCM
jgi:hypothetical protein